VIVEGSTPSSLAIRCRDHPISNIILTRSLIELMFDHEPDRKTID